MPFMALFLATSCVARHRAAFHGLGGSSVVLWDAERGVVPVLFFFLTDGNTIHHGPSNLKAWFVHLNCLSGYEPAGANVGHSLYILPIQHLLGLGVRIQSPAKVRHCLIASTVRSASAS